MFATSRFKKLEIKEFNSGLFLSLQGLKMNHSSYFSHISKNLRIVWQTYTVYFLRTHVKGSPCATAALISPRATKTPLGSFISHGYQSVPYRHVIKNP